MSIFVTGACGNIGEYVIEKLLENGLDVVGFDVCNTHTKKVASRIKKTAYKNKKRFEIIWGSLISKENGLEELFSKKSLQGIIHLAFVIPPFSEMNPEEARKINVEGTKNLIELAKRYPLNVPFVFSSSTTVFGPASELEIYINEAHSTQATSHYTEHKLECEKLLKESILDWRILRFSAVMNPTFKPHEESIKFSLHIPLETHVEPVHVYDVAQAVYNALTRQTASRKIFIIAGGKKNQTTYQNYYFKLLCGFLGDIKFEDVPWYKFRPKPYYLHWYDTTLSEAILAYQKRTIDDYIRDAQKKLSWWKRCLLPFARKYAIRFLIP